MKSASRSRIPAASGAGLAVFAIAVAGCDISKSSTCTPFPAPSLTGAACSALPVRTKLYDLGATELGGGDTWNGLTVDDTAIYYTAGTPDSAVPTLYRLPKTGGVPQALDVGVAGPVLLDGPTLVYTRMNAVSQSGGGASFSYPNIVALGSQCFFTTLPEPVDTAPVESTRVDGLGGVLWIAQSSDGVDYMARWDPRTATTTTAGAYGSAIQGGVVTDKDHVYVSVFSEPTVTSVDFVSTVIAIPTSGGPAVSLGTFPGTIPLAGVDDDSLFLVWAGDPTQNPPTSTVLLINKVNGAVEGTASGGALGELVPPQAVTPSFQSVGADPGSLLYRRHDTHVYWAAGAVISRAPKSGGPTEVVMDLGDPNAVVLAMDFDACNVYATVQTTTGSTLDYAIFAQGLASGSTADAGDDASVGADGAIEAGEAGDAE